MLLRFLVDRPERYIIYCDDLSFDRDESSYKALKSVLDGGLEGRPANTLFYATSNRRHLMPRDMIENERSTAINPSEAVEEKVSLSDRFGLWLGFHNCDQDTYLAMVRNYVAHYGSKSVKTNCVLWRSNGRRLADPARAASPSSSFATWRASRANRSPRACRDKVDATLSVRTRDKTRLRAIEALKCSKMRKGGPPGPSQQGACLPVFLRERFQQKWTPLLRFGNATNETP